MILAIPDHQIERTKALFAYQSRGWLVIPVHSVNGEGKCTCRNPDCRSAGKHPIPSDWTNLASVDPSVVEQFWRDYPYANVGVVTGRQSGIFVVDLDGIEGIAAFDELVRKNGEIPETYTVKTGGGGRHLYFRYPTDRVIKNRSRINHHPIDVRGDGGQILAPPSLHRSGHRYEVLNDVDPAEAPEWLLDFILPPPIDGDMATVNPTPPSKPGSMIIGGVNRIAELPSRVRAYLAQCPPAVSGQGDTIAPLPSRTVLFMALD